MSSVFTKILNKEINGEVVYEDENFFAILDINPMNAGHTLLITKNESKNLFELSDSDAIMLVETTKKIGSALKEALGADGVKLIQNNGASAGQEVMHFHIHIVPFYSSELRDIDKNDLTAIANKIREKLL